MGKAKPRTKSNKTQDSHPPAKRTRLASTMGTLMRTIHQQVSSQSDQTGSVSVTIPHRLVPVQAAYLDRLYTQPGHSTLASHHLLQGWDSLQLSCQLCGGVLGDHLPHGYRSITIIRGTTTTGNNWVQHHIPGLNNNNNQHRLLQ